MIVFEHPPASFDAFLRANEQFWSSRLGQSAGAPRDGTILVDLLHNNASVLILNLIVGRYLAEFFNADLRGFLGPTFTGHAVPIEQVTRLARSFGVKEVDLTERDPKVRKSGLRLGERALAMRDRWQANRLMRPLRKLSGEQLRKAVLNLTIERTRIGDLVYDTYLDVTHRGTIEEFDAQLATTIERAHQIYKNVSAVFADKSIRATMVCHPVYIDYGIPLRVSLANNVPVFGKVGLDPIRIRRYDRPDQAFEFINTPLEPALSFFRQRLGVRLSEKANQFYPPRQSGSHILDWFRYGYGQDKNEIGRAALIKLLGIQPGKKTCLVMAHQFADCPHCGPHLLFDDHYQWLDGVLKFAKEHPQINWLVRQHPYEALVGETQVFNELIQRHVDERSGHIAIVPNSVTTSSLFDCVDATTTATGTGGIEFASVGVPCILAGDPFYGDLDFMIRPRTIEEYFSVLAKIPVLPRLSETQIMRAKEAALVYLRYQRVSSSRVPYIDDLAGREIKPADIDGYWEEAARRVANPIEEDPLYICLKKMIDERELIMLDQFVS